MTIEMNISFRLITSLCIAVITWTTCAPGVEAADPVNPREFEQAGITAAWAKYADRLSFGKGQTLALVDDGCKLSMPQWQAKVDGVPKVLVTYDSVDGD